MSLGRRLARALMSPSDRTGWPVIAWLALVCLLSLFHGLFTLAPLDKTEALQIGIAETMLRDHSWVLPHWNGHLYSDKPPLPYWLAAVVWTRFGLIPELARLPAALWATLGVAAIAVLLRELSRRQPGPDRGWQRAALGGSLLALSPGWIAFAHTAVHDIYLAVAVTMALAGYASGFGAQGVSGRHRLLRSLWIGGWCGVGFLSKGLLGVGLPLLVIAVDAALHRPRALSLRRPLSTVLLLAAMTAVVAPWLGSLVIRDHWDYLQGFLGFSHLARATRSVDGHTQPLFFYLPVLLALLLPWWPLLLAPLRQVWQRRRHWRHPAAPIERLQLLAALWLLLGLALFSLIPTKLPGYVLPLIPAAALLIATARHQPIACLRLVALQLVLLGLALMGAALIAPHGGLGAYGRLLASGGGTLPWLALLGLVVLLAAGGAWRLGADRRALPALLLAMLLVVVSLPALARPYRQLEQQPLLDLARAAHRQHGSAGVLYVLGRPRYSVVAEAQLPTIFGSPLRPIGTRPDSSHANWLLHRYDREMLVLGHCRSVQALARDPAVVTGSRQRRGPFCLASVRRLHAPVSEH